MATGRLKDSKNNKKDEAKFMRLADSDNGDKEGREVNYPSVLRQAVSIPDRKRPACAKGDGRSIFQKREDRRKSNKRERKRLTRTTTATP